MIDIENIVFNCVAAPLRKAVTGISISGETVKTPSKFPYVELIEKSNTVCLKSQDENVENHANLMYEINIYSNLTTGKKPQCRKIMSIIDTEFQKIGFTRTFMQPIPNIEDYTIYRITARYVAVAGKNNDIYRK
ncbi:MAG: hypothetical protein RR902_00545 [Oscillospiraceae bacterium]